MLRTRLGSRATPGSATDRLHCSFCNKTAADVKKLIAGPTVFICDECIAVCNEILAQDAEGETRSADPRAQGETVAEQPVTGLVVQCGLCGMEIPVEEGLPILNRGLLCAGCAGEVEASIARTREPDA